MEKCWRRVLERSVGEEICREMLEKSDVERCWREVLEKSVVEKAVLEKSVHRVGCGSVWQLRWSLRCARRDGGCGARLSLAASESKRCSGYKIDLYY